MSADECEYIVDLASQDCVPCRGGVPPLDPAVVKDMLARLGCDWTVVDGHHLSKTYAFPDFKEALRFTNLVGDMAEEQGHHPDLLLAWGKVRVDIWTHKIDALVESDFVFAAKTEAIFGKM